jgi:hypothetical protein
MQMRRQKPEGGRRSDFTCTHPRKHYVHAYALSMTLSLSFGSGPRTLWVVWRNANQYSKGL